jgi:hypothetical protein
MKAHHILAVAACLLVIVGIVAGFIVTSSPSHARDVTLDQKRIDDLKDIASRVRTRYNDTGVLPATLPSIWAHDPVTKQPYTYRRIDASHFMLCATFAAPTEHEDNAGTSFWSHGAGQRCYALDQSSEPVVPVR